MKLQPISKSAGFNHVEARKAFDWVMDNYDEALAVLPFALYEDVQNTIFDNRETIQKALDLALEPQYRAISKALGDDTYDRDARGRFAAAESRRKKPIRYGVSSAKPERKSYTGGALSSPQRGHYQAAYEQVADEIDAAIESGMDAADTFWTAVYRDPQGRLSMSRGVGLDPNAILDEDRFRKGGRLVEIGLTSKPNLSAGGAAYDLMTAMGSPTASAQIGGGFDRLNTKLDQGAISTLAAKDKKTRSDRLYSQLRSAGELATHVMGDNAPAKLKLAAATATWVGTHGPEAQQVLGPPAQRAAYRYRGVEKKPDPRLQGAIDGAIKASKTQAKDGMGQAEINSRAREAVVYGYQRTIPGKRPGMVTGTEFVESPLIRYFQERLPNPDLYRLQQKSGTVPPSQGVIIDRHGRVAHEAVGYGEDWYLPFNLKNLKALKGGEYVRTRAYGGLTTEDIYTGLVAGARSVTVVSNSGVFTLEFDDSFRGGRRLNDKAARMVSRYGFLLDAIDNGQVVVRGLDPSLKAEIKEDAARRYDPVDRPAEYASEVKRQEERAGMVPRLSRAQVAEASDEIANDAARDWAVQHGYDAQDLADVRDREAEAIRSRYAAYAAAVPGEAAQINDMANQEIAQKWGSPEAAIKTMGADDRLERVLKIRLNEARKANSTLRLDGEGYDYAAQALAEQFPYYVSRYSSRSLAGRDDRGYVARGSNRPDLGRKPRPEGPSTPPAPAAVPTGEKAAEPKADPAPGLTERIELQDAAFKAAAAARAQGKIGPEATGELGGFNLEDSRGANDATAAEFLQKHFGALLDPEFEEKWGTDPAFKVRAVAQMRLAQDKKVFDIDFGPALGAKKKTAPPWSIENALSGVKTFDFGPDYAADAGGTDPAAARAHFLRLLDSDPDVRQVLARNGLDSDDITGLSAALPGLRAQTAAALGAWARGESAYNRAVPEAQLGMSKPDPRERDELADDLRGLDKAITALTHAATIEREAAKPVVVEGAVAPQVEVQRAVASNPAQAAALVSSVEQSGREPLVMGALHNSELERVLREAGLQT